MTVNILTLALPLAFTFAIAAWGPLSTQNQPQPCADSLRNNRREPCED
jgi:hypothetical protein